MPLFQSSHSSPFLFFLSIAFLGEQLGIYSHPFNRLLGVILLFCYMIPNILHHRNPERINSSIVFMLFYGFLLLLTSIVPQPSLSIACAIVISVLVNEGKMTLDTMVGSLFFLYHLLNSYVPQFFLLEKAVSNALNTFMNSVLKLDIHFSPYAYGFGYLVILLSISLLRLREISSAHAGIFKKTLLTTGFLLSLFSCYLSLQFLYFKASIQYTQSFQPEGVGLDRYIYSFLGFFFPMNGHLSMFLFLLLMSSSLWILTKKSIKSWKTIKRSVHPKRAFFIYTVFLLSLGLILSIFFWNLDFGTRFNETQTKSSLFVYRTGMDFQTVPDSEVYGEKNGHFALFLDYTRDWGYETCLGVDWEKIVPQRHDIIVMINPSGKLSTQEKKELLSFLQHGGRLFVLGDHTHMFGLENEYFDFIEEMGITFRFDTAIYFRSLWKNCLHSPFVPWNSLINRSDFITNIVQGASLDIRFPALPIVVGRYGWSDSGDLDNEPGYLGDRLYSAHEPTGDVVLAAERRYGKGKILVFGDTSFIQNSPVSTSYPLIRLCLAHLEPKDRLFVRILFPFLFIALGLSLWFISIGRPSSSRISSYRVPAFLLMFCFFLWLGSLLSSAEAFFLLPPRAAMKRAAVDSSFFNDFFQRDWHAKQRGVGGLKNTIYRAGMLPYLTYRFYKENSDNYNILLLTAPNKRVNKKNAAKMHSFVKEGGVLILACGLEHREGAQNLLDLFGMDIEDIPLSNLSGEDTDKELRMVSAWPVKIVDAQNIRIVCTAWKRYPVIVEKEAGSGKFILISDSFFFENRNLEKYNSYYKHNSTFVQELIEQNG